MQLEAGKKYTDRRGRVYGPMIQNSTFFGEGQNNYTWSAEGRISSFTEYDMDLVAEYVEPVQPDPEYRLLQDGELIQDGDEFKGCSGKWERVLTNTGYQFSSKIYFPHRRLVEPVKAAESAPVESTDDWVILDPVVYADHVPRVGIDQFQGCDDSWETQEADHSKDPIGEWHALTGGGQTRCRRKDLPPKTRTVILKEWLCWDDAYLHIVRVEWCSTDPSEDSGLFLEYGNAHPTGNTRTVEIPVT
jgi:hypothetical protein